MPSKKKKASPTKSTKKAGKKKAGKKKLTTQAAAARRRTARTVAREGEPSGLLRREVERFAARHQVTLREKEVLTWMAAGYASAEELAAISNRSRHTLHNQIKSLLRGTGTHSKTGLLALFIDHLLRRMGGSSKTKKKR
jgi:DNA-binding CsgD family transcriptional regulator